MHCARDAFAPMSTGSRGLRQIGRRENACRPARLQLKVEYRHKSLVKLKVKPEFGSQIIPGRQLAAARSGGPTATSRMAIGCRRKVRQSNTKVVRIPSDLGPLLTCYTRSH
jgi:hypothetical protein